MINRIMNSHLFPNLLKGVLVLGVLMVIFTPDIQTFKWAAQYAIQFLFGYLALGLFFFSIDRPKLMFTSLLCCATLALYLQKTTNDSLRFAKDTLESNIKVAHFNVSGFSESYEEAIDILLKTEADIISVQEVTPDWNRVLIDNLRDSFPYLNSLVRFDLFGQIILSKFHVNKVDTIYHRDLPYLKLIMQVDNREVCLISSHALPPLDRSSYDRLKDQLFKLAPHVQRSEIPVIVVGDFNLTAWSREIRDFKTAANLKDSRRGVLPTTFKGAISEFEVPLEHIFFTDEMECIQFDPIIDHKTAPVGISGTYQFKSRIINSARKKG